MSQTFQRVRGLVKLAGEAVEHGSRAVERVHRATTARPFAILERIPVVAGPARLVHEAIDLSTTSTYFAIRAVSYVAQTGLELALDVVDPPEPGGRQA